MEQKILKMVAWTCGGDNAFGTMNYEDIDEKEMDNNSWWYLHGKLEEMAGYDKATCINCREIGISFPTINWTEICGSEVTEIKVEVTLVLTNAKARQSLCSIFMGAALV